MKPKRPDVGAERSSSRRGLTGAAVLLLLLLFQAGLLAGYYEEGCRYYMYRKYDKAREKFLKAVEVSANGDAYYFLGEIEKNEGKYEKAIEYYGAAVSRRMTPKYMKLAYWDLIVLTEQRGDYPGMAKWSKEFWRRAGDDSGKRKIESFINKLMWSDNEEAVEKYNKGMEAKNKNDIEAAEKAFHEAAGRDSSFLAPRFELGMIYYKKGRSQETLAYLQEIADKIPFYGEVHLFLGNIYFERKSYREAVPYFDKTIDCGFLNRDTEYLVLIKRGTCYYNLKDYARSRDDIGAAQKIKGKSLEPPLLLSAIFIKEENYREALKTLEKANILDPDNSEVLFQLGSIHYKLKDKKYVSFFSRLFRLNSAREDVPDKYYKAYSLLAKNAFEEEDFARVARIAETIPAKDMDNDTLLLAARACYREGDYEKSARYFEKASLTDEDRYLLCRAYMKEGKEEKAKRILMGLAGDARYLEKAKKDKSLKKIADEVEKERGQNPGR